MLIAPMRTLEQKISDAGPADQRVDPLVLSRARQELQQSGVVAVEQREGVPWYRLSSTPEQMWKERLARVGPILDELHSGGNSRRIGKTLEIAVFKALREGLSNDRGVPFVGGFQGLDDSDEETWRQIEPPSMISGRALSGDTKLDFILFHPTAGPAAMEVKNTREWMHPDKDLMLELLRKSCELDAVPVMICRRYAYVTFSVLHRCGVLLHQNYNQLLPEAMRDVAEQAKNKDLLGYHDIRLGTEPDSRLRRFVGRQLQSLLPEARERFDEYKDLLWEFACGEIDYKEFAGRSRRREQGVPEDFDQDDGHEFDHY